MEISLIFISYFLTSPNRIFFSLSSQNPLPLIKFKTNELFYLKDEDDDLDVSMEYQSFSSGVAKSHLERWRINFHIWKRLRIKPGLSANKGKEETSEQDASVEGPQNFAETGVESSLASRSRN